MNDKMRSENRKETKGEMVKHKIIFFTDKSAQNKEKKLKLNGGTPAQASFI